MAGPQGTADGPRPLLPRPVHTGKGQIPLWGKDAIVELARTTQMDTSQMELYLEQQITRLADVQRRQTKEPASCPARKRPPRAAVKDAPGTDLRPDPRQTRTAAELVTALVEFHQWAGEPSFRAMADQCGQRVSASTLHRALTKSALPPFDTVMAVIIGCGGSEEDQRRFASAWRMVRSGRRPAAGSPPAALRAVPAAKTG